MSYTGGNEGVTGEQRPRLLEQVRARLRVKHYSVRTEQAYVAWIRRFVIATGGVTRVRWRRRRSRRF